jgi:murein DD-endopeptidase MepM/ murein hydrolase activator NlpD
VVIQADTLQSSPVPTFTALPAQSFRITPSPSFIDSTPVPTPEGLEDLVAQAVEPETDKFQLPPEEVPLSAHPFDHYYLTRPIDVTANSQSLFYYPYGSGGNRGWRTHHGVDMPNAVGQEVRAAGDGIVVCADRTTTTDPESSCDTEVFAAYGNMVVIQHDFGWRGMPVWTLYAHLSAITVAQGERVKTGDIIGLVGATGQVTGPHVHFEVRVANNRYLSTRNPLLWMAPYIGHGVVAGRVVDSNGQYLDNILVQLNRGGRVTDSTLSYLDPYVEGSRVWSVVPDENWQENFVLGDIPEGEYQIVAVVEDQRYFPTVNVVAGSTSFVEIQVGVVATPQAFRDQATAIIPTLPPTALPSPTPQ